MFVEEQKHLVYTHINLFFLIKFRIPNSGFSNLPNERVVVIKQSIIVLSG